MARIELASWQMASIYNPYVHFAMLGGVATGKTFTGSHFAIHMMTEFPELTGFVGANTYDQMSQATLKELFYWLEEYGFEFVIDCRPPVEWKAPRLKSYKNILTVWNPRKARATIVFTRVLADGNPLRGVEFAWYWIDESRDTPQNTHDIILSRMRESDVVMKGLVTTTTNGEDWAYQRFVRGRVPGSNLYGSMHVQTIESVKEGIISQPYYDAMLQSYSPLMAAQELFAEHVNVQGGRAYYAFGRENRMARAPWGDYEPNPSRPLVIGCDFNFTPAPCIWMIGQVGPPTRLANGQWADKCIHWFDEIAQVEASTPQMTEALLARYPYFFYRVYGDASGQRGTTSNAGEHDYNQISQVISDAGYQFTIDVDQSNPLVRNRVENMNRLAKNAAGEIHMTYDPERCPNFDADTRVVGWKKNVQSGRGKLDNNDDVNRTHASDGAGYAAYKIFPPVRTVEIIESIPSAVRSSL